MSKIRFTVEDVYVEDQNSIRIEREVLEQTVDQTEATQAELAAVAISFVMDNQKILAQVLRAAQAASHIGGLGVTVDAESTETI